MQPGVVIVGAGHAGFTVAMMLRQLGYSESVTIIGDEPSLPYQRPPLSKRFLLSSMDAEQLLFRPHSFFIEQEIKLLAGTRATSISVRANAITLDGRLPLSYSHLVIATGARHRQLLVPGFDLSGVTNLGTMADATMLRDAIGDAGETVIIGAGYVGLEVAAAISAQGRPVHVIDQFSRPLGRSVGLAVSRWFQRWHEASGVRFHLGRTVRRIMDGGNRQVSGVELDDGKQLPANIVISGIGIQPRQEIAVAAGLPAEDGILVDHTLRTSAKTVFAIGDCARFYDTWTEGSLRLESAQNATDQARYVARQIVGQTEPYRMVPWVWSTQREQRLQICGLSDGATQSVIRGDEEAGLFSVFLFQDQELISVQSVNRPVDYVIGRRILSGNRKYLSPQMVADPDVDLSGSFAV